VLIVEDDDDLRNFLHSILQSEYLILMAGNGREGLQAAQKHIPDFVVSDVMMPEMDGIEMLRELKTNLSTSHIPVVLLTAKGTIDNRLEGLEFGADDYIVKPFSVPYFRARIRNLLRQRQNLQELYCSSLVVRSHSELLRNRESSLPDREFIDRIVRQIEEHLDESNYPIEALTRSAGISRTAFFRKIKTLTGMSPVEFVREVRIRNAEKLLKTNQLMVKEVCYMVGFTDLKYFTRCFKQRFGVTPAEFKKNQH
jgi:DNA-binding response OmpR family regulator